MNYYNLVPILCGFLTSVLAFGYLFLFSLNGYFFGDTITVYEDFLANGTEYYYARGFSKLCLSLSTLSGFPIFNTLVWIGTIFTPFVLYLSFYLFCTNFISEKTSILAAYMFSVIGVTFISFAANMKQNMGLVCVIICLHISLRENREKDGELKKSVLFTLSYGLLSAVHLFSFVIGTLILIPVIEVHAQLKEEKYRFLSINRHTGIILLSIPFFRLLFNPLALEISWILRQIFLKVFQANPEFEVVLEFISSPLLVSFYFFLGFVGYLCGIKLILVVSLYVRKLTTRVFERRDRKIIERLFLVGSVILSGVIWIGYNLRYHRYIEANYYNIFGFLLLHLTQIFFYGISFYLIFTLFFPIEEKSNVWTKSFALVSLSLLGTAFAILAINNVVKINLLGNFERRFLDFLPLVQVPFFLQRWTKWKNFERAENTEEWSLATFIPFILICVLELLFGARDAFFFRPNEKG